MLKLAFNLGKNEYSKEYTIKPTDYSDGGELYYRENEESLWQVATPPARYRARQDCYEKFGKEKYLARDKATAEEQSEMTAYFNKRVKIYETEEKNDEK